VKEQRLSFPVVPSIYHGKTEKSTTFVKFFWKKFTLFFSLEKKIFYFKKGLTKTLQ